MTEYILTIFLIIVVIYAFVKGCTVNINVTLKQEINEKDRQLLEDIYNDKGDVKSQEFVMMEALDEAVRNINNIMLDNEEGINGE